MLLDSQVHLLPIEQDSTYYRTKKIRNRIRNNMKYRYLTRKSYFMLETTWEYFIVVSGDLNWTTSSSSNTFRIESFVEGSMGKEETKGQTNKHKHRNQEASFYRKWIRKKVSLQDHLYIFDWNVVLMIIICHSPSSDNIFNRVEMRITFH